MSVACQSLLAGWWWWRWLFFSKPDAYLICVTKSSSVIVKQRWQDLILWKMRCQRKLSVGEKTPTAFRNQKSLTQPDFFWRKRSVLECFGEISVLCLPEHGIAKLTFEPLFFSFSESEKALIRIWKIFQFCFCYIKHNLPRGCDRCEKCLMQDDGGY